MLVANATPGAGAASEPPPNSQQGGMAANTAAPVTMMPAAASAGTPSRHRAQTGSGCVRMPGKRPMKEFPLTKTELYGLASVGGFATLCFSGGSAALGYASTVTK